jgi:hypothetical protein
MRAYAGTVVWGTRPADEDVTRLQPRTGAHKNMRIPLSVAAALVLGGSAMAAPPPGTNPNSEMAGWYHSLVDHRGIGCCSAADCRRVEYRMKGDAFEVFIDKGTFGRSAPDAWVAVPAEAILPRENPTGEGVACFYAGQVHCFVQAGAT